MYMDFYLIFHYYYLYLLIDKLSYERLVKLNQLYDEKITELERLSLNVDINKK